MPGGEGDGKKGKPKENSSSDSITKDQPKNSRKRKDGTANKMSFDVDELEEGTYIHVEDEDEIEEVVDYEEDLDEVMQEGDGEKKDLTKEVDKAGDLKGPVDDGEGYKIRPDLTEKFRPGAVQVIIENAIKETLEGKEYSPEECEDWVKTILEDIHEKVKGQNYKRYKIITQITLGERRGEGASCATRCLWDSETDCMATYTFLSDSLFCNGTVYGIYYY